MVTLPALKTFVARAWTGFALDRRGVAAVEFAILLPILALLALGCVEVTDGLIIKRKLTHTTSSIGDLIAQSKIITDADMANIMLASTAIMRPYPEASLKVIVSGVLLDADSNGKVLWSDAKGTEPLQIDSTYDVPDDLKNPNTFLVISESSYVYTPRVAYLITGDVPMKDLFFMKPRLVAKVCRPPQTAQSCN
jgi:Flp pilus assembly protein TadG